MKNIHIGFGIVLLLAVIMSGCSGKEKPNDFDWKVNALSAVDQNGNAFATGNMAGKVWLADFMFTSCTTVCPPMTYNLTQIQDMLKGKGIQEVEIVSFSVDPSVDTPEKLKQFIGKYEADTSSWRLVTGYDQKTIEQFSRDSFKTLVLKTEDSDQVTHGTSFFLVDQSGTVLTKYDGLEPDHDKIAADVRALLD
ncbi:SCO family protein [Paenibacillus profundus]|uniref:SCO family protein n=1 Tax=Paenibacillus profundus TaxID=1173085 RepID=A0ABS8YGA3_9BACL|nr:SCO family protein [Paenibacillus profundus]MCE5169954.1 SCO family protein [Paenibacillus profundus]